MMAFESAGAGETEVLGGRLAAAAEPGCRIHLSGQLAAGKTTLVRGFLRGLGHTGPVVSPTYTLIEPYRTARFSVHHFDLYRLRDATELEGIGFRDYFDADSVCLVEWPERGAPLLGSPDISVHMEVLGPRRRITLEAGSEAGRSLLRRLGGSGAPAP